jgi:hypothetical protein
MWSGHGRGEGWVEALLVLLFCSVVAPVRLLIGVAAHHQQQRNL